MKTIVVLILVGAICRASVGCRKRNRNEDYNRARIRALTIENAELHCQTDLIGKTSLRHAKDLCHQKFQEQWDQWVHEFPKAAREDFARLLFVIVIPFALRSIFTIMY